MIDKNVNDHILSLLLDWKWFGWCATTLKFQISLLKCISFYVQHYGIEEKNKLCIENIFDLIYFTVYGSGAKQRNLILARWMNKIAVTLL